VIESLIVLAKRPVPGLVKTRLTPPFTPAHAAELAAAALLDTLDAVDGMPTRQRVLAFAGDANSWLRPGWAYVRQRDGGLDERIAAALAESATSSVLIGMDTPQLQPQHLAGVDLVKHDACLGLSSDGGYWAIGLADPSLARRAVCGVPMSTPVTGIRQLERLATLGLEVQLLDTLTDVDTVIEAREVAKDAPWTGFAKTYRDLVRARHEDVA
jgi:glycosyltransferase A (GT-A) superfamily protein (DUF2064 family)